MGDAVGGVVADAVMLVKDWEYATPRGSFSKLERGDIEARDLIEYYAISREHSRNRITATT